MTEAERLALLTPCPDAYDALVACYPIGDRDIYVPEPELQRETDEHGNESGVLDPETGQWIEDE